LRGISYDGKTLQEKRKREGKSKGKEKDAADLLTKSRRRQPHTWNHAETVKKANSIISSEGRGAACSSKATLGQAKNN